VQCAAALYIDFAAAAARGQIERIDTRAAATRCFGLAAKPAATRRVLWPDPACFAPGTWYFDTRERAIVYIVRFRSGSSRG